MIIKILIVMLIIAYALLNLTTARLYSSREMVSEFITGQCTVGMIFANIFYAPAWALKFIRGIINMLVK